MLEPELDVSGGKAGPADPRAGRRRRRTRPLRRASSSPTSTGSPALADRRAAADRARRRRRRPGHLRRAELRPRHTRGTLGPQHLALHHPHAARAVRRELPPREGVRRRARRLAAPKAPIGYSVTRRRDGGDGILRSPTPTRRASSRRSFERAAGEAAGPRSPTARRRPSAAGKVIRNRVYLGEINYAGASNPAAHEPIVDVALFEAAQLDHPRPPRGIHPPALLAGLVRCAGCQRKMTPNNNKSKGERIYRCHPRNARGRCQRARDHLAGEARRLRRAHLLRPPRQAGPQPPTTDELEAAERELQAAEAELAAYQQAHARRRRRRRTLHGRHAHPRRRRQPPRRVSAASAPCPVTASRSRSLRAVYERSPVEGRRHRPTRLAFRRVGPEGRAAPARACPCRRGRAPRRRGRTAWCRGRAARLGGTISWERSGRSARGPGLE
jgi:hypothetical protein